MNSDLKIGFLGAGKMATALAKGFVQAGLIQRANLLASDCVDAARDAFAKNVGSKTVTSNAEVVNFAKVLFVAVKPAQVSGLLQEIREQWTADHLLISIAAGVPLLKLNSTLGGNPRVVRVMPNTPALVGAGACAYSVGEAATSEDAQLARQLLSAVGVAYQVPETLLDAVTGLSGSGPAYGFLMIEALSDGGVAAGLPRDIATKLAAQTLMGSAKMVLETGLHPGALKDMVTSPGGTTIDGIHQLEIAGVRAGLINAVRAAAEKSKSLGQSK